MRRLKKNVPSGDIVVYLRQSKKRGQHEHAHSRGAQLQLVQYAMRSRGGASDAHIRVYDEGEGANE